MPIIVTGGGGSSFEPVSQLKQIDYDYPYDLDLRPQSKLHQQIVQRVLRLADESYSVMQARHASWREVDRMMTAFIPLSEYERGLKSRNDTGEAMLSENRPVSIVVPYAYVTYETIMTYITQALLNSPVFQFEGAGPEDTVKAKLLELACDAQVRRFKGVLDMHTALGDSLKYGMGGSTFKWHEVHGRRSYTEQVQMYDETSGRFLGITNAKGTQPAVLFEGNKVVPIDPYRMLPDPNVSISNIQDGEFFGWIAVDSFYGMLQEEQADMSVFNIRYLDDPYLRQKHSRYTPDLSDRGKRFGFGAGSGVKTNWTNYITAVHMFIKLIPREWGLPGDDNGNRNGEYPEKWLFTVANDTILTRATRHNLNHDMYPAAIAAPDYDGYTCTPVGRIEMLHGLQEGMNWLYNAHIANVRKAINDMFIVDPSLIVMNDIRKPGPGKLVRLRKRAWGRSVKDAVMQLPVNDVTRGNINDSLYIADIMQRVSAAGDAVQGIVRSGGERRSATEYRTTVGNALSRLEHITRLVSLQYIMDMGYMMASQTQQFMSRPIYGRIVGNWPQTLSSLYQNADGLWINPEDILVDYDVIIRDGSVPSAGQANGDLFIQLFQMVTQSPELQAQFDVPRLFTRIATMLGDKNAYDFIRRGGNVATVPAAPDQIEEGVRKGNLLPLAA